MTPPMTTLDFIRRLLARLRRRRRATQLPSMLADYIQTFNEPRRYHHQP